MKLYSIILCFNFLISIVIGNEPRKIAGFRSHLSKYPHQVSVRIAGFKEICSGSILNRYHVVTTASCVIYELENVMFGNINIFAITNNIHELYAEDNLYDVQYIIYHPEYKVQDFWKNDIAILRLERSITYSVFQKPAILPSATVNYPRDELVVTGQNRQLPVTRNFEKVNIVGLPRSICLSFYRKFGGLVPGQSCFKTRTGVILDKINNGDGGCPITSKTYNHLIGFISLIPLEVSFPVVFTKIVVYVPWIFDMTEAY